MYKIDQSSRTFRNSSTNLCLFCSMDCMSFRTPENISFLWPSISTRRFCKLHCKYYITSEGNYMLFTSSWLMLQVINGNIKKVNAHSLLVFFIFRLTSLDLYFSNSSCCSFMSFLCICSFSSSYLASDWKVQLINVSFL